MAFERSLHIFHAHIYLKPISVQIFITAFEGKLSDPRCTGEIKSLETEEMLFYTEFIIILVLT